VDETPLPALLNPQLLHPYSYAANNPVAYRDPDGQFIQAPEGHDINRSGLSLRQRQANVIAELRARFGETVRQTQVPRQATPAVSTRAVSPAASPAASAGPSTGIVGAVKTNAIRTMDPEEFLEKVVAQANTVKARAEKKGLKLRVDPFINALTEPATMESILSRIDADEDTPPLFAQAPRQVAGRLISESAIKNVGVLMNSLKSIDLTGAFRDLSKLRAKQGFDMSKYQKQIDEFRQKYLEDDEEEPDVDQDDEE